MSLDGWPTVELGNVRRMRVLGRTVPNARMAESIVDAPFDRVWEWFSDLERSVPAFDGQVRRLHIRRRDGDRLRITSWQGRGGLLPMRFDVLLERDGWCLMTAPARFYVVGMCAEPVGEEQTHVAVLEAMPRRVGRVAMPFVRRHVAGDAQRIGDVLGVSSRPVSLR
ncbi:MAG: hypothetical protein QOH79_1891 [Acidimicrobiaceae bacterium]